MSVTPSPHPECHQASLLTHVISSYACFIFPVNTRRQESCEQKNFSIQSDASITPVSMNPSAAHAFRNEMEKYDLIASEALLGSKVLFSRCLLYFPPTMTLFFIKSDI